MHKALHDILSFISARGHHSPWCLFCVTNLMFYLLLTLGGQSAAARTTHTMRDERLSTFYNSKAWKRCRATYRKSVGNLCEKCLSKGIYTPGEIVHHLNHITPETVSNPNVTLSFDNLELLCRRCHAEEHPEIYANNPALHKSKRRYRVYADGTVTPL